MSAENKRVLTYLRRANELRSIAASMADLNEKEILRATADEFERLARALLVEKQAPQPDRD